MRRILLMFLLIPVLWAGGSVPRRVVSQTVGTDDLLLALAAPGQIAALSHLAQDERYSPSFREARNHPRLANSDAEAVLRFQPDLVLAANYSETGVLNLLRRAKVNLLIIEKFETLEDLYANARRIGKVLGREAKAEELIRQWQARVAALHQRLQGVKPVRVLAVGLYPFTAGSGTTFQDLCDHAGALNVAAEAGLKGHAPTPGEQVLSWRTEVLVAPGEPGFDMMARLRELPPYKFLPALKQGRVVELPGSLMASTSQARIEGYERLARLLHPERFP
jgi:iron complex transport system substrate-binding protein